MKKHGGSHPPSHKTAISLLWITIMLVIITAGVFRYDILGVIQRPSKPKNIHVASGGIIQPFLAAYDEWFQRYWKQKTGQKVTISHEYGATGDLMRAAIAKKITPDVLLLSNPYEVDAVAESTHAIDTNWRIEYPHMSSPFSSSVVFVVRKGNPKHIADWSDLTKPNISLLFSNPKICGGGRWVYTALLDFAKRSTNINIPAERAYLTDIFKNVPILYANQGDAQYAFIEQNKGDVLITYEIVAIATRAKNAASVDIVEPPQSVEIDFPVAIAQAYTDLHKTTDISKAYVANLYNPEVQQMLADTNLHSRTPGIKKQTAPPLSAIRLDTREDAFTSIEEEQSHLDNAGIFDSIYTHDFAEEFDLPSK